MKETWLSFVCDSHSGFAKVKDKTISFPEYIEFAVFWYYFKIFFLIDYHNEQGTYKS